MKNLIFLACIAANLLHFSAEACTTFMVGTDPSNLLVGRNMDWVGANSYAIWNPRGVVKKGISLSVLRTHRWTSKYASLTFSSGLEQPVSGMNEAGLVGVILWLEESAPKKMDLRPELSEFQWLQWQLDTSASIEEVEKNARKVRLHQVFIKLHYWFCDRSGGCILVENLNQKLHISHYAQKPVRLISNNTFDKSFQFLSEHTGFGGDKPVPQGPDSLSRFVRAASLIRDSGAMSVENIFGTLDKVAQHGGLENISTDWQEAYDVNKGQIYFRSRKNSSLKFIDMKKLSPNCAQSTLYIDLASAPSGDMTTHFQPLTYKANLALIRDTASTYSEPIPDVLLQYVASYPWWGTYCL